MPAQGRRCARDDPAVSAGSIHFAQPMSKETFDALKAVLVPRWYWWVVGVLVVPIGVAADSHQRVATAVVAVVSALVIAAVSVAMVRLLSEGPLRNREGQA